MLKSHYSDDSDGNCSNRINKIILDSGYSMIMKMVIQIHEDDMKSLYA